jgi:hypothetical protein
VLSGGDSLVRGLLTWLLVVTLLAMGLAAAWADERADARKACEPDYRRLCGNVLPGGGRAKQCLLEHSDRLSPDCRAIVQARAGR